MPDQPPFPPVALTIAGSDSGGGAGIQADLKAMSALGVYGASVLTALTAQNTLGVAAIHDVPADFVTAQMDAVFGDLPVKATKIGMLSQPKVIEAVADGLIRHKARNIVLDPVMVATSGDRLLAEEAVSALKERLMPLADIITPNLYEAALILGADVAETQKEMEEQAKALLSQGARAVLLKGGHSKASTADDLFLNPGSKRLFSAPWIKTRNTHGTGCTLSAAIAAYLARGMPLMEALAEAKTYLFHAMDHAKHLTLGKGAGPVHHFYEFWPLINEGKS